MKTVNLNPLVDKDIMGTIISKKYQDIEINFKEIDHKGIVKIVNELKKFTDKAASRSIEDYIYILDKASKIWIDNNSSYRKEALQVLPSIHNKSKELVEKELDLTAAFFTREVLERILRFEIGNRHGEGKEYLEEWVDEGLFLTHLAPRPGLVFHNLSGNSFIVPALSIVYGLLSKKTNLLKVSSDDPYFGNVLVHSLWSIEPSLRKTLNVVYWRGKSKEVYDALFQYLEDQYVVQWGEEESTNIIKNYCKNARVRKFIDHGPRISFEVIEEPNRYDYKKIAYTIAENDVILWEQYACTSARFIFVLEKEICCEDFAKELGRGLEKASNIFTKPSQRDSLGFLDITENYMLNLELEGRGKVFTSKNPSWCVIYSVDKPNIKDINLCFKRILFVSPIKSLEEVTDYIDKMHLSPYLQTLGYNGDNLEFCKQIGHKGISIITYPGEMSYHMAGTSHDGIYNLRELMDPFIITRQKKTKPMYDTLLTLKRSIVKSGKNKNKRG